jgi:hypothetical protein
MKHQPTHPTPPEAWLVVLEQAGRSGQAAFPAQDDPGLLAYLQECQNYPQPERFRIMRDDPSLDISYSGLTISNPCWLTVRDNWFQRHQQILDNHLRDPRVAQVFTYAPGALRDPLTSLKSSADGPCPLPSGSAWPVCGLCEQRMAFVGVLDFREYSVGALPGDSLVLHICKECLYYFDPTARALTWIARDEAIEVQGDQAQQVSVGTRWFVTEYPTPAFYAEDLAGEQLQTASFLDEKGIFFNFTCFADKVGGHVFWIQEDNTPADSQGHPMVYIGQLTGSDDVHLGDCGLACIFYSPNTTETEMIIQFF